VLASILQIIGLTAISLGLGLFNVPLGIIAIGASCVLVGISLERGN
jgi:peptidoglycan biosynthesis protein MviN/MurJ (putative lipid II flippase)